MQTPFKRWQGPFQPPFARAPRSNLAAALAANALHWWDAGDRTSLLSGVDGSGGVVGNADPAGVWIDRAGQGGKTGAQILSDAGGVVANLPGLTGFAPAVSQQPSWGAAGALGFDGVDDRFDFDGITPGTYDVWAIEGATSWLLTDQDMTTWADFSVGVLGGRNGFTLTNDLEAVAVSVAANRQAMWAAINSKYGTVSVLEDFLPRGATGLTTADTLTFRVRG